LTLPSIGPHFSLDPFLQRKLGALSGLMSLRRVCGGQSNPTFFINYDNRRLVLRKRPPGSLLAASTATNNGRRMAPWHLTQTSIHKSLHSAWAALRATSKGR
jgi:aminoglycoside phosphotransferase (APT) family kinase protein